VGLGVVGQGNGDGLVMGRGFVVGGKRGTGEGIGVGIWQIEQKSL
jgi:hypothetical protein